METLDSSASQILREISYFETFLYKFMYFKDRFIDTPIDSFSISNITLNKGILFAEIPSSLTNSSNWYVWFSNASTTCFFTPCINSSKDFCLSIWIFNGNILTNIPNELYKSASSLLAIGEPIVISIWLLYLYIMI